MITTNVFCTLCLSVNTSLGSPPVHTPCSTQRDIRIICPTKQGGTWRAPRSSAPPPRDDTPEICSVCDSGYTCDSPVHVATPEISLTLSLPPPNPSSTHTHTGHLHHQGQERGFSLGRGARRRPRALIFTSPTMTLCNWWHKWPPAAPLSCYSSSPVCPLLLSPQFNLIAAILYFSEL